MISVKIALAIIVAFFVGIVFGTILVSSVLSATFKKTFDDHVEAYDNALSVIHGLRNTYAILENEIESVEGVRTEDEDELDDVDENYIEGIIYAMNTMKENIDDN